MQRGTPISRAVAWLMLATYVVVASGLPLPIAGGPPAVGSAAATQLADKDRSRPFPCMDKPCGCTTAEQCFAACCCNTPAELLAWASTHDLDPATLRALKRRAATPTTTPVAVATCCCAETDGDSTASCTASPEATAAMLAGEVCADYRSLAADEPAALPAVAPACGMVSLRAMLACGGILAGWSAAMISLPAPAIVRVERADSIVGLLVVANDVAISVSPTLDVPPPRA
jgi:hypothetical protein